MNIHPSPAATMILLPLEHITGRQHFAGATSKGSVHIWNINDNSEKGQVGTQGNPVNIIRFRDGGTLAIGYTSGTVEIWDIETGTKISEVRSIMPGE
ncbi:MAG: WD40 repeat domain-containing protein [Bacteroidales bacterium]